MRPLDRRVVTVGLLASLWAHNSRAVPTAATITLSYQGIAGPLMPENFPDPSIIRDIDGTWYAFATSGNGNNVQAARGPGPVGPWTYINQDLLPDAGSWAIGANTWAPDVRVIGPGKYVLYYAGQLANDTAYHCIGVATAATILGPYAPQDAPWACPIAQGGAIDPSGFLDEATGTRYVVYKVDGNSIGHGGFCDNGVAPFVPTPILLQQVSAGDGTTKIGGPVQILDRTDEDGPLVEAPDIARLGDGVYVLFYSSECYTSPQYSVRYATAADVEGPYTRAAAPLIGSGSRNNLTAPGGATSVDGGGQIVFHANCAAGRCLFGASYGVEGLDFTDS